MNEENGNPVLLTHEQVRALNQENGDLRRRLDACHLELSQMPKDRSEVRLAVIAQVTSLNRQREAIGHRLREDRDRKREMVRTQKLEIMGGVSVTAHLREINRRVGKLEYLFELFADHVEDPNFNWQPHVRQLMASWDEVEA